MNEQDVPPVWSGRFAASGLFVGVAKAMSALGRLHNCDWQAARWDVEIAIRQLEQARAEIQEIEDAAKVGVQQP